VSAFSLRRPRALRRSSSSSKQPARESPGLLARTGTIASTLLALTTGYLLALPKQALDLEKARSEGQARNGGSFDLTVNRVASNEGSDQNYLVLATMHTKAAGGRGVQIRKITFKLFLGQPCSSALYLGTQCLSGGAALGRADLPVVEILAAQGCQNRAPTSPVIWNGLPGDHASDMQWHEVATYDTEGMNNGAGPLGPGESASSSMQWAIAIPKDRTGVVAVTADVRWCEEAPFDGLFGTLAPDCSEDGRTVPPDAWSGKRFNWTFSNSALLSLAPPIEVVLPK
jgi:hypothetical protein